MGKIFSPTGNSKLKVYPEPFDGVYAEQSEVLRFTQEKLVEGPVLSTLSGNRLRVIMRRREKTKRYRRALSIELRVREWKDWNFVEEKSQEMYLEKCLVSIKNGSYVL